MKKKIINVSCLLTFRKLFGLCARINFSRCQKLMVFFFYNNIKSFDLTFFFICDFYLFFFKGCLKIYNKPLQIPVSFHSKLVYYFYIFFLNFFFLLPDDSEIKRILIDIWKLNYLRPWSLKRKVRRKRLCSIFHLKKLLSIKFLTV